MKLDFSSIFTPKNVAVIGVSPNFMKWGAIIAANIFIGGYKEKLFLVNPRHKRIYGIRSFPSIKDIRGTIDLVYVALPSKKIFNVLEECGEAGVKSCVVIAGGFSEIGSDGRDLERDVLKIANKYKIQIIGPNTMGICNPRHNFYGLMPPINPMPGNIGFISQSGNLGTQLMSLGEIQGIGFSKFVSSGNEIMLRTEDYLEYLGQDPDTEVILCYIEGLRDGKKFLDVAKKITPHKPIIVYKAGKTAAGSKAAQSHTGSVAGSWEITKSMFRQARIIEAGTSLELLDLAKAFSKMPPLKGKRVGILSWGGGWAVVCADHLMQVGLEVPPLSKEAIESLNKILPPYWSKSNPIDLVGTLDRRNQLNSLRILFESGMDGIVVLGVLTGLAFENFKKYQEIVNIPDAELQALIKEFEKTDMRFVKNIKKLVDIGHKPIVAVALSSEEVQEEYKKQIVIYSQPETAANILSKMYQYYQNKLKK
ncbi:MAG: CoA-binding protein [Candidatus Helarchaeota archaeon]|nr:CoA-binding protein [Candidatus Helarchaeota archaeon]